MHRPWQNDPSDRATRKIRAGLWLALLALCAALAGCAASQPRTAADLHSVAPPDLPPTLADVRQAQEVVKRVAFRTPLVEERALSGICGAQVYLKLENLQRTGSFKVRGAFNKIASLPQDQRAKGVVTASAGNHAQGVALGASVFGVPATVVMPKTAPENKVRATEAYGAHVVLYGKTFDESLARAHEIQRETGAIFVHPFDDPMTISGQGTIGLEILEDLPDADVVLVPVGGGGLAAGIATAIKGVRPSARVVGVQPENAPSMAEALKRGRPVAVPVVPTHADGTAVGQSGEMTFKIAQKLLDGIVTVSEDEIANAILLLLFKDKVLSEGAGALGAAALMAGKVDVKGKKVVVVVSGGNIDPARLEKLLSVAAKKNLGSGL
jgi:threonine dehydratase